MGDTGAGRLAAGTTLRLGHSELRVDVDVGLSEIASSERDHFGAQVIGMSADDIKTLHDFSTKECRSAFPVATATPTTQKAYDVAWAAHPGITTRTLPTSEPVSSFGA